MDRYIAAATFVNEVEAELAQATLAAAGIESFLKYEDIGGMLPSLQESEGVQVLVDEKFLVEAQAVLNDRATEPTDPQSSV
jgi:putative signal transducing protein